MTDPTLLKEYPCPVCASTDRKILYPVKGFDVTQCSSCSMVYVNPRIRNEKLFDQYTDRYFQRTAESGYENYELTADLRKKTFRRWYGDLSPWLPAQRTRALDIGCAAGYFLDILKDEGWQAEGVELDRDMIRTLQERGYTVIDKPLEHIEPKHKYDLITLFDVLEHLPGINDDFDKLSSMLTDNGIIALVTPDFGSTQRKIFGRRWFQYKPYEHIYYFSFPTLRRIAEKHGFSIVHARASGQYADFNFLHNRLQRYGFSAFDKLFTFASKLLRLENSSWYADTGSLFVILKKSISGVQSKGS